MQLAVELSVLAVLLLVNAFLAASEISIISARKPRLRALAGDGNRAAKRVLALAESPSGFLATVQVGITLASFFAEIAKGWFEAVPIGIVSRHAGTIALIVVTIILSFVSIVVGELVPKTLAALRPEPFALRVVRSIELLAALTRPLVSALTMSTNFLLRLFGTDSRTSLSNITHAEILAMLEVAEDEGVVESSEADLVEDALGFGEISVRSVMVPRVDVISLHAETTLSQAIDLFFSTGFSRLPVHRENQDDVLGILHVKDVFRLTWGDAEAAGKPVADFVRPVYFIPETKPIDTLRTHIAIVLDEYGGMAGLVTLEDMLEELVGEIADEFDPGYEPYREVEPGVYDVDGRVSLADLFDVMDVDRDEIDPVDAESVGGLIADRLGRIPVEGDQIETGPLRFEVRAMDGYRVALARVQRIRPPHPDDLAEEDSNRVESRL
jgi:putative hemolysin